MSNDLTKKQPSFYPEVPMQQTGENNVAVTNQVGGIVNFNYNITTNMPLPFGGISSELMIAVQSFSKKYYQLLVTCEEDVFENNIITIPASRALTQYNVPEEIFERCSTLTDAGIEELKTFPAIICRENTELKGVTDPNQWAMYAYIKKVRVYGKDIKIAFQPIGPIRQQVLCSPRNAIFFDLNMDCAITDLNHSAWSVHKTNLFEAFKEAGINNLPMPSEEVI